MVSSVREAGAPRSAECPLSSSIPADPAPQLREALSRFAAGVTVVTTVDTEGRRWGFTACSFTSLSLSPPLILVCLDQGADCHPAFSTAEAFAVNILRPEHDQVAASFATKGADKFAAGAFTFSPVGLPVLSDALAAIECRMEHRLPGGDHTILVGRVARCTIGEGAPMVYYARAFRRLEGV